MQMAYCAFAFSFGEGERSGILQRFCISVAALLEMCWAKKYWS